MFVKGPDISGLPFAYHGSDDKLIEQGRDVTATVHFAMC